MALLLPLSPSPSFPPSLPRYPDGVSSSPSAPYEVNEESDKSDVEYELVHHGPEGEEEEEEKEEGIGNEEEMVEEI